jgi:hypothetical protein
LLNERQMATQTGKGRFGAIHSLRQLWKTERRLRQRVTRPLRERKAFPNPDVGGHKRPRAEWIKVPEPALVSEEMFALAQERLERTNVTRRGAPSSRPCCKGMLFAKQCGYACTAPQPTHLEAKAELLSLSRFGWISTVERASFYESANQVRLS